jgi:hydroxyquinol 1,2-dioxygenase
MKRDFGGAVLLAGGVILRVCGRNPWHPSYLHYIVKADSFHTLVAEIIPDGDPYLDQDNVFRLQDDLVMRYVEKPVADFPSGMALSGQIHASFLHVNFDVTLASA